MAKKSGTIVVIFKSPPNLISKEGLEFVMLSASLEQKIKVFFIDTGVLLLNPEQNLELIGMKNFIKTFKALPIYEVDEVYASAKDIATYNIDSFITKVTLVDNTFIKKELQYAHEVLVF